MKYFSDKEIGCPCGCDAKLASHVERSLDLLRELYGKPIFVEQAATCKEYSVEVVGRKNTSTHIDNGEGALAIDVKKRTFTSKKDYVKFLGLAAEVGFTGFGQGIGWFDIHKTDKRFHMDKRVASDLVTWVYY